MILDRRTMLKTSAVLASTVAARGTGFAQPHTILIVFDSRLPKSRTFARAYTGPRIDVAQEDRNFWRKVRATHPVGPVSGMTSWSDWVMVRGLLEEQGKRLKSQQRVGALFRWEMA